MGKTYAPETIPEVGAQLIAGRYLFGIDSVEDDQRTGTGKYMIKASLRVIEPATMAGVPHFENFVIGTDADPEADDPECWKGYAAGRYRQMMEKAGVSMSGDVEADAQALTGQRVGGVVIQEVQAAVNRDGSANPYAGRVQARINFFFHEGERETGFDASNGPSPTPAQAKAKPGPKPGPKPVAAAPAPVAKAAPAPAAKPAAPAAQQIKCTICNQTVLRKDFAAHVQAHEGDEE